MRLMKITKKNILEILTFLQDVAYEAGEEILKFQKKKQHLQITNKGADGIASEADEASEKIILEALKKKFPKSEVLSEEAFSKNKKDTFKKASESEFIWLVDPLDGTNNFVNGIPIYAVSIALLNKKNVILGLVYNPLSGECFYAGKGIGSFLVDYRINPLKKYKLSRGKNKKEMNECIFSPAPVYDIGHKFERQLSVFKKNISGARAVRRLGSAALELCYVASGNFDAYWEKNLKPWDVAAAQIICEEAGVKISDFNGGAFHPYKESVIAAAQPLHSRIVGKIK